MLRYKAMTRKDLENKNIEKLNSIDEAIELINLLNYDECIKLLNSLHNVPSEMLKAIINRAKSLKGNTPELLIASLQCLANN